MPSVIHHSTYLEIISIHLLYLETLFDRLLFSRKYYVNKENGKYIFTIKFQKERVFVIDQGYVKYCQTNLHQHLKHVLRFCFDPETEKLQANNMTMKSNNQLY